MGFLKKVAQAVSAPVTAPLKVASNVIREGGEAFGVTQVTGALSNLAAAPYNAIQKGEGLSGVLPSVQASLQTLAPLASAAGGIPGINLGGTLPGSSLLTGLLGSTPSQLQSTPVPSGGGEAPAQVIYSGGAGSNYTTILLIGGAAIATVLLLRRRRG